MYFVRPTSSSKAGGGAGAGGDDGAPDSRSDGPSAAERQAEREENGPVAAANRATAAIRLVDDDGQPLSRKPGKIVFSDGREVEFKSGSDGRFFVGGLEPDASYEVFVDSPGEE